MMNERFDDQAYEKFVAAAESAGFDRVNDEERLRALFVEAAGAPLPVENTIEKLARVTNQVCSVLKGGAPVGTGFLIGPKQVLTAHHVLNGATSVVCVFNNIRFLRRNVSTGSATRVAARVTERVSADLNGNVQPDHLDFAVLELELPVGNGSRGFVTLDQNDIEDGETVYIVDHPENVPAVVFSAGTVTAPFSNEDGLIFFHNASTAHGASGAPVFNDQFELIGMHRSGPQEGMPNNHAVSTTVIKRVLDGP
jgi:endonuclease G